MRADSARCLSACTKTPFVPVCRSSLTQSAIASPRLLSITTPNPKPVGPCLSAAHNHPEVCKDRSCVGHEACSCIAWVGVYVSVDVPTVVTPARS